MTHKMTHDIGHGAHHIGHGIGERHLGAIAAAAKFHLTPLALVELAAFAAALLAGWELIAAAILGVHLLHMGVVAFRGRGSGAGAADSGPERGPSDN